MNRMFKQLQSIFQVSALALTVVRPALGEVRTVSPDGTSLLIECIDLLPKTEKP